MQFGQGPDRVWLSALSISSSAFLSFQTMQDESVDASDSPSTCRVLHHHYYDMLPTR